MMGLGNLLRRNCKLFFKDKGLFFTSLITPLILLVLYATFLANVYRDSFLAGIAADGGGMLPVPDALIDATVGGQLLSSLLAVCCVTVSFCSNMLMVQDKITGARKDLTMTAVKNATMALGYYLSTAISTLIICLIAAGAGLAYLYAVGWYLTAQDVGLLLLDMFLLVMFGTALSSLINVFLSTQGQISAVGSIVSSVYGFLCGAYMPISQFSAGLQKALSFLPGTYATSLLRNHCLRGVFAEMKNVGFPETSIEGIKESVDCTIYFFDKPVSVGAMYTVLVSSVAVILLAYVLATYLHRKSHH